MTGKLTQSQLQQLLKDVRGAGDTARRIAGRDESFSYAAMSGCLSALLAGLVRDLAGPQAVQALEAALKDAFGEVK